jgi:hypothetical protein
MATWQFGYYNAKVQAAIEAWPAGIRASYMRTIRAMAEHGPNLGMPRDGRRIV